jgi:integrase
MAGLQFRNGSYRIIFRYQGKQHAFTLGEVSPDEADAKAAHVDYLLMRLKQKLTTLPAGMSIIDYLQFDGQEPVAVELVSEKISLKTLRERYLSTHENSLEKSTVTGVKIHFGHLEKTLGPAFIVSELTLADLQRYIDVRSKSKGLHGRKLSAATIQKEIVSLRTAWNWAARHKLVAGKFPNQGLRFPKQTEKPAFQTRDEIKRRIEIGGMNDAEISDLWDALYLKVDEIEQVLAYVKKQKAQPFVYPMICTAAYTGARRAELIRMQKGDIDFIGKTITIREKKRVRGKTTTRRVPLSGMLAEILTSWLQSHPGGPILFCQQAIVSRSRSRSRTTGHRGEKTRPTTSAERVATIRTRGPGHVTPVTPDEANDHLTRVIAASEWNVIRGWHTFRHSFISACASKGIDQRLVESWAGHMSADMSRRYSHLYPSTQQEAMARVFN